jgi:NAD-dependent dihydropyrimidine dehydrogenase PreA subunit
MGLFAKKTRIEIDYSRCGDGVGVDPRSCRKCLVACKPAVFLMHQTLGVEQANEFDPDKWRITPFWLSLCTKCNLCAQVCPVNAITVQ